MQPLTNRARQSASVKAVSTLSLINEAFTRLRASAAAYKNACSFDSLCGLKAWMESYGSRLGGMADQLQDEGARSRPSLTQSAVTLYDKDACSAPRKLLEAAEHNQYSIVAAFELLTERLDMDADLYELLTDQAEELSEALSDMADLRREYEAYGDS